MNSLDLGYNSCHFEFTTQTHLGTGNGRQRIASQIQINLPSAQIVDNHHVMSAVRQVQRCGPSTESVATQDHDLFLFIQSIQAIFSMEGKVKNIAAGSRGCRRKGQTGGWHPYGHGQECARYFHHDADVVLFGKRKM
jgi:hypothetical protein